MKSKSMHLETTAVMVSGHSISNKELKGLRVSERRWPRVVLLMGKGPRVRVNKQQQVCATLNEIRIRNEREKEKSFLEPWWGSYMGEVKELHEGERHGKWGI